MRTLPLSGAALLFVLGAGLAGCGHDATPPKVGDGGTGGTGGTNSSGTSGVPHVEGDRLVDEKGAALDLRGIAFGNWVWWMNTVPNNHHSLADYARVKAMGFNAIRFYLNYEFLETTDGASFKEEGFAWLDDNIAEAKKQGIRLVLNMHVPPGGFQSLGKGSALWSEEKNKTQLAALWREIARRYADEATIVGYGLLNEPYLVGPLSEWSALAGDLVKAVRAEDKGHALFLERPIALGGGETLAPTSFPTVDDDNVVYEFHFYEPFPFTHQLFEWGFPGDGGKYPDETIIATGNLKWEACACDVTNPTLPPGDSEWTELVSDIKYITDEKITAVSPEMISKANAGTAYFDQMIVEEYDSKGKFLRELLRVDIEGKDGWYLWAPSGSPVVATANDGKDSPSSVSITGSVSDANLNTWNYVAPVVQGNGYRVRGYAKGTSVPAGAEVMFRLQLLSGIALPRNKALLEAILAPTFAWAKEKKVPLYLGEFGAGIHTFENDKGGLRWIRDVLDIARTHHVSFNYHTYHEDNFGIFYGGTDLPDPAKANEPLIDFFTEELGGIAP